MKDKNFEIWSQVWTKVSNKLENALKRVYREVDWIFAIHKGNYWCNSAQYEKITYEELHDWLIVVKLKRAAKLWRLWRPGHPFIQTGWDGEEAKAGRTREKNRTNTANDIDDETIRQIRGAAHANQLTPNPPTQRQQVRHSRGCAKLRTKALHDDLRALTGARKLWPNNRSFSKLTHNVMKHLKNVPPPPLNSRVIHFSKQFWKITNWNVFLRLFATLK